MYIFVTQDRFYFQFSHQIQGSTPPQHFASILFSVALYTGAEQPKLLHSL